MSLSCEIDGRGIARLTLNRPDKRNALSAELIAALHAQAEALGANADVRVVLLSGAGKSFCAGGDLAWMKAQITADRSTRKAAARALAEMLRALDRIPKPLLASVHGSALGGGTGLACVCDAVFAAPTAQFGLTETRLGLIPATISPYVIARMGPAQARSVFLSSRPFDAATAQRLGIVFEVCADPTARAEEEAEAYLACAPGAVARAKAFARSFAPPVDEAVIERTIEALADTWEAPEALQGISAFFDKTNPPWRGQ
ncbi:MAG: crotonase/enoyl-CoA hydratase family protein [Pseudomonadota bacterium]